MELRLKGNLTKMRVELSDPVSYHLLTNEGELILNDYIGKEIQFKYGGTINCRVCGKKTSKSFAQGNCYMCFRDSPSNAPCIIRPELCEGHLGKGRDVEWEQKHHVQPHYVYLALSSGLKIGVTRETQVPTRFIDQGARQAIFLCHTPNRYLAGQIEVELKEHLHDKTHWQRMLKGEVASFDLLEEKEGMLEYLPDPFMDFVSEDDDIMHINYPVTEYPEKVKSQSFDKLENIGGTLIGIHGQYLIFPEGKVMNIRKHTGYFVEFSA